MKNESVSKISIIGTGFVGSTTAYTLMLSGLIPEIVLIDINEKKNATFTVINTRRSVQFSV